MCCTFTPSPAKFIDQPLPVWPDLASVKDARTSAGKGGRLVRAPLPPAKTWCAELAMVSPGRSDVFDLINEVDVERAEVEDVHPAVASR